tara:strand:- start:332 stop:589 length:258 start_codon:yes stop_codon:yes gene_type:complete
MSEHREYFKTSINSESQAIEFFNKLYIDNLLYHPAVDGARNICENDDSPLLTKEEAKLVNERMDEVWLVIEDPCKLILKLIDNEV